MTNYNLFTWVSLLENIFFKAYKCGNFAQIVDINGLKRRIQHSFLVPLVEVERLILELSFKTEDHPQVQGPSC